MAVGHLGRQKNFYNGQIFHFESVMSIFSKVVRSIFNYTPITELMNSSIQILRDQNIDRGYYSRSIKVSLKVLN